MLKVYFYHSFDCLTNIVGLKDMGIKNQIIDFICKNLKKLKTTDFVVHLRVNWQTPEENTRELLRLVTEDFDLMRARKDDINLFVGRFMGAVLMIELKLEQLLLKVDQEIEFLPS